MALKNNWANGDTFTPAAANDLANAANASTGVTVDGASVSKYELDQNPLKASDVGAYTRDEVDDAIDSATTFVNTTSVAGNLVASVETTITSAGTKTLNVLSNAAVQVFTGSSTHTVKLPITYVSDGWQYRIINRSSGNVTVQASNGDVIGTLLQGDNRLFVASSAEPGSAASWSDGLSWRTGGSPSTLVARDANINVFARNFFQGFSTTATAAGTTTLSVGSNPVQEFTGSTTQVVKLPTTSLYAGAQYTIVNSSSGAVTVQSSGANTIVVMAAGTAATFTALVDTPTTAANWANGYYANYFLPSTTSTVTAAGTTTLTIAATQVQVFTGSTTQTVKLPTTSVTAGTEYRIINNSTGSVTVQSSGANTIATVTANTLQLFIAQIDTPTTAAHWRAI